MNATKGTLLVEKFKKKQTEVPEDFIVFANNGKEVPEEERKQLYEMFCETIDDFLEKYDGNEIEKDFDEPTMKV